MRFRNRLGQSVDPVPFLVVASMSVLFCYAFGPAYLMEFGTKLASGLVYSTAAFLLLACGAYYRLVWTARPDLRHEVPAEGRLRRLVLAGVAVGGVIGLLLLPLLTPHV